MASDRPNKRWSLRAVSNRGSQIRAPYLRPIGWPSFSSLTLHRTLPSTDARRSTVATGLGRDREAREYLLIETSLSMAAEDQKHIGLAQERTSETVTANIMSQADVDENVEAQAEQWVVVDSEGDGDPSNANSSDDSSESSLEHQIIYDGIVYEGDFNEESSHVSGSEFEMIRSVQSISRRLGMIVHPTVAAAVMDIVEQCKTELATTAAQQDRPEQASADSTRASGINWPFQSDEDLTEDDVDFLEWIFVAQETELGA